MEVTTITTTRISGLLCLALLFVVLHISTCVLADVQLSDLKIFVNKQEFFVKGMVYHPAPLGQKSMDPTAGTGGGGLCSTRKTPFGEYKSACFDSDYFDGSDDPNRVPPGPDEWFKSLWDRDFPLMKELGVNTLRIYNCNPITRQASIDQLGQNNIVAPVGKSHLAFMDQAYNSGFMVIFPLMGDYNIMVNTPEDQLHQLIQNQIDEIIDHPGLLMFTLGNELPVATDAEILAKVNHLIGFSKQYMSEKYGKSIPITHAVVDDPTTYNYLARSLDVDVFTANAGYRGLNFQNLWNGTGPDFVGWKNLSRTYNKPLFIGEIGQPDQPAMTAAHPDWFNQQWQDLVRHIDDGCIGGAFFEYSDEELKEDPLQQQMGVVSLSATISDGKASTEENVWVPDTVSKKATVFEAVKSGLSSFPNTQPYNMNADVFKLIGREPATLPGYVATTTGQYHSQGVGHSQTTSGATTSQTITTATLLLLVIAFFATLFL